MCANQETVQQGQIARKKRLRKLLFAGSVVGITLLLILLLWGPLFPYSPVSLGFARHELSHAVIMVERGADFSDFARVNALIPIVESFHELRFRNKPKLFVFRDDASYVRHTGSHTRFFAAPNSNIVIAPWALREDRQGTISLDIYLRHELSHALIFQQTGVLGALRYPPWLLEGIGVYSTNQCGTSWYPGKAETLALIKRGNFMPPLDFKTRREDQVPLNVPYRITFMYSEFGCIVDDLVQQYGREKFLGYMKRLCETSDNEQAFREAFGMTFAAYIDDFVRQARQ
jgi:hypothetical protein